MAYHFPKAELTEDNIFYQCCYDSFFTGIAHRFLLALSLLSPLLSTAVFPDFNIQKEIWALLSLTSSCLLWKSLDNACPERTRTLNQAQPGCDQRAPCEAEGVTQHQAGIFTWALSFCTSMCRLQMSHRLVAGIKDSSCCLSAGMNQFSLWRELWQVSEKRLNHKNPNMM